MSNALAIAAVTAVLRDLLDDGLINANISGTLGVTITVTVLPPDLVISDSETQPEGLNLFLYQVTPNPGWRNVGLPTRDAQGDRISNQPLALDLHYLLTAYSRQPLHAEILLGYGMQLLHETSVLTRRGIRRTLSEALPGTVLPPAFRALSTAQLAEQVEQIKIAYQPMTSEEMFRLWSTFQTPYRPTAAYQATVVLIEPERIPKSGLPVLRPNLYIAPFRQPIIEQLLPLNGVAQSFVPSSTLVIRGQNLQGDVTKVRLGGLDIIPEEVSPTQIRLLLLPLTELPNGLKAGVQPVQVLHQLILGTPADPHVGSESNVAALILRPVITASLTEMTCTGEGAARRCLGTVVINVVPSVERTQRVVLLLDQLLNAPNERAQTYRFAAPENNGISNPDQTRTSSIRIPIRDVIPGTYLVRMQVDGAESLPEIDLNRDSPTYNQYTGQPQIILEP
jgi:hypothetical protein